MMKSLILTLLLALTTANNTCYPTCSTCLYDSTSPYVCTSCLPNRQISPYLFSCQPNSIQASSKHDTMYGFFFAFSIVCCVLMFFLVCMGHGTYRQAFQNLQLIAIFTWQFNTQSGGQPLIVTNWCWIRNGMTGTPAILFLIIFATTLLFILISLFTYNRLASDPMSMLIKRKRNVFTFRLFHLTFNGLTFASFMQIQKAAYAKSIQAFSFSLAVIYLFYMSVSVLVHISFLNQIKSLDDPYTKVYIQNQTSKMCMCRNHVIISFMVRIFNISFFVFLWMYPTTIMISCTTAQLIYSFYFAFASKYKKKRYTIVNLLSNILLGTQILIAGFAAVAFENSNPDFNNIGIAWMSISFFCLISLCVVLLIEIIANWMQIKRQLRSIYYKYIICTEEEQDVILNIYDEAYEKSKVQHFMPNPLHLKKIQLSQIADAI